MDQTWVVSIGLTDFLAHFVPIKSNQSLLECHSICEYCCWPNLHGHNLSISQLLFPAWKYTMSQSKNSLKLVFWTWQITICSSVEFFWEHLWDVVVHLNNLQELHDVIISKGPGSHWDVSNILWNLCQKNRRYFYRRYKKAKAGKYPVLVSSY